MAMQIRLNYVKASPGAVEALFGLEVYRHGYGLEHGFLHLVKLRASQINGCAYRIDVHSKDSRAAGCSTARRTFTPQKLPAAEVER
jgi:alkylhydroperoxidase family enzyme